MRTPAKDHARPLDIDITLDAMNPLLNGTSALGPPLQNAQRDQAFRRCLSCARRVDA